MSDYDDKQDRYLWLEHGEVDHSYNTQTLSLTFRYFDEQGRLSNFNDAYCDTQGGGYNFDSLEIRAQYENNNERDSGVYGWGVDYHAVYYVDLDEARSMVKTLNRVETGMSRMRDKWGRPQSFSQYVIHVANLFQVKGIMRKISGKEEMMVGKNYKMHDVADASYAIAMLLNEYGLFSKEYVLDV